VFNNATTRVKLTFRSRGAVEDLASMPMIINIFESALMKRTILLLLFYTLSLTDRATHSNLTLCNFGLCSVGPGYYQAGWINF
jgi:hypothetical protein